MESPMANTKTRKSAKSAKRSNGGKPVASPEQSRGVPHAYADRLEPIADIIRHAPEHRATVADIYRQLKTKRTGLFGTERRVAAAIRYDKRTGGNTFYPDGAFV